MPKVSFAKSALIATVALSLIGAGYSSLAGTGKGAASGSTTATPLNNIVKMDAHGKRTVLCCCLNEFTLTDGAPSMDHGGTTFYMCGEGCKEMAMKSTPAQTAETMTNWNAKYATYRLADNTFQKSGKTWAKCGCGKEFEVTDKSLAVVENGVTMFCCTQACHEIASKMGSSERLASELKVVGASTVHASN
jgi:predicted peroxiredoxin